MNPISVSIHDTRFFQPTFDHVPRLYNLSKKLSFFVRYLNSNYEGLFINAGVSGMTDRGNGCFILVNGEDISRGNEMIGEVGPDENGVSRAERAFLSREEFDESEFNNYSSIFIKELEVKNLIIKRRTN